MRLGNLLDLPLLAATPATPPAGEQAVYAKTDGHVYTKDASGAERQMDGGGGGGSSITVVTKTNYYDSVNGDVVLSNNAAVISPADPSLNAQITIKNIGTGGTTIIATPATVDGAGQLYMGHQYQSSTFVSDGVAWFQI